MYGWCFSKVCCESTFQLRSHAGEKVWQRHQYRGVAKPGSAQTWSVAASGEVIVTGSVNNPDGEHVVVGWNPSGDMLWSYDPGTSRNVNWIVALSNGNFVCFEAVANELICLDGSDGSVVWTNSDIMVNSSVRNPMAASGTDVAVIGNSGSPNFYTFWRIDGTDGSTDVQHAGDTQYRSVCLGGLGTFTAQAVSGNDNEFYGLNADGTKNGSSFTLVGTAHDPFIAALSSGNLVLGTINNRVEVRDASGNLVSSDTSSFDGNQRIRVAVDGDDNIYAYAIRAGDGSLLVKYDGADLSAIDWSRVIDHDASVATGNLALYSPSLNAQPVIGYDELIVDLSTSEFLDLASEFDTDGWDGTANPSGLDKTNRSPNTPSATTPVQWEPPDDGGVVEWNLETVSQSHADGAIQATVYAFCSNPGQDFTMQAALFVDGQYQADVNLSWTASTPAWKSAVLATGLSVADFDSAKLRFQAPVNLGSTEDFEAIYVLIES